MINRFKNILLSIILVDLDLNFINRDYIILNDYIDKNLSDLLNMEKIDILCQQIPHFYIKKIIYLLEHFNSYEYKANIITKKLIYILYYFIQKRSNIIVFYEDDEYLLKILIKIHTNFDNVIPWNNKFLDLFFKEINLYINESKKKSLLILQNFNTLPIEIIKIIIKYNEPFTNLQIIKNKLNFILKYKT